MRLVRRCHKIAIKSGKNKMAKKIEGYIKLNIQPEVLTHRRPLARLLVSVV